MIRNNYLEELGVERTDPQIRLPYALVILALLAAAVAWLTVAELKAHHPPPPDLSAVTVRLPASPGHPAPLAPHGPTRSPARHLT